MQTQEVLWESGKTDNKWAWSDIEWEELTEVKGPHWYDATLSGIDWHLRQCEGSGDNLRPCQSLPTEPRDVGTLQESRRH